MNIAWEGGASTSYFERLTRTWGEGKIVLHLPIIGILGYSLLSQSIPLNIAWEDGASISYFKRRRRTWGEGKIVELGGTFANFRICCWSNSGVLWSILCFQFWFLKTDVWHSKNKEYFVVLQKFTRKYDVWCLLCDYDAAKGRHKKKIDFF